MRSKTIVYCEGLNADGTPCDSHFETEHGQHGVVGMHRQFPPGWWQAHITKVIPPRERPPQPNIFERGPLRQMLKAMSESITPPDLEKATKIREIIERAQTAIGDIANGPLQAKLAAELAMLGILTEDIVMTPAKLDEQIGKMYEGLKSGYDAGYEEELAALPAPRDRTYPVSALLCSKHPQPEVQFDESKVPHWAGMSIVGGCDHDYVEAEPVDLLGGTNAAGIAVAPPVGFGG